MPAGADGLLSGAGPESFRCRELKRAGLGLCARNRYKCCVVHAWGLTSSLAPNRQLYLHIL